MEREDGEMSDDNAMLVDDEQPPSVVDPSYTVLYKADKNGLKVEKLEKVDAMKIEERAKRFGLNLTGNKVITQRQIDELYSKFGVDSSNKRHFRFDTLYLNGVDGLTTKEIFKYLEDFKPISLEWIEENACNIVCQDHITAALALLVHSREIQSEELQKILSSTAYYWREGMPHEKKDLILMRFATNSDKKETLKKHNERLSKPIVDQPLDTVSKNPWGGLCQSWGMYDHQEILNPRVNNDQVDDDDVPSEPIRVKNASLAKRLGKRRQTSEESDSSSSSIEWRSQSKTPRMRMHADDEESRLKKKKKQKVPKDDNCFAPLSIEVVNVESRYRPKEFTTLSDKFNRHTKSQNIVVKPNAQPSVHSRLGMKVALSQGELSEDDWTSDNSSVKSDRNVMSRVQKLGKPRSSSASDVWSRLEANNDTTSDLRQKIKTKTTKTSDLRGRLGKAKPGVSLRIEVENDDYFSSD